MAAAIAFTRITGIGFHIVRDRIWKLADMAQDPVHRLDFAPGRHLREKMENYFDLLERYADEMTETSEKFVRDYWLDGVDWARQFEMSRLPTAGAVN